AFLVRCARREHDRHVRPRLVRWAFARRHGQQLELGDRPRSLTIRRANAVAPGVASAYHDHVLSPCVDLTNRLGRQVVARHTPVLLVQVVPGKVNPVQVAAAHLEVPRLRRAHADLYRIVLFELFDGYVDPDVRPRDEPDAFLLHDGQAAVDDPLFELEVGDAVPKQPADAVVAFV